MTIGLLLITHAPLGSALLRIASEILGTPPAAAEALEISNENPALDPGASVLARIEHLDQGGGVLILTDLYGATPANLSVLALEQERNVRVLSGVNLAMLLKALNYADLDLDTLAGKVLQGGRDGIILCSRRNPDS